MYFVAGAGYAGRTITKVALADRRDQATRLALMQKDLETTAAENALL